MSIFRFITSAKQDGYNPVCGGLPAISAYTNAWGTRSPAKVIPATMSARAFFLKHWGSQVLIGTYFEISCTFHMKVSSARSSVLDSAADIAG
jgi:hypothetical protein